MKLSKLAPLAVAVAIVAPYANPLLDSLLLPQMQTDTPFNPNMTDVLGYKGIPFARAGQEHLETHLGYTHAIERFLPKWLKQYISLIDSENSKRIDDSSTIDILDARYDPDLTFRNTGFTLLKMDAPSKTKDFRSSTDIKHFQEELRPKLLALYPGATRIEFTNQFVRGGNKVKDIQPSVNVMHLDFSSNSTALEEFHDKYPLTPGFKGPYALLGQWDTDDEEVKVLAGIWKPIYMKNPVCDHPLAVMDASSFRPEDERPISSHVNLWPFLQLHHLAGGVIHNPEHRWYYYPFQDDDEVLVFTQHTKGKTWVNPHGSFENPNCPSGYQSRMSVEMRVAVFFPKEKTSSVTAPVM